METLQIPVQVYASGCNNTRNTRTCGDFVRQEECSGHDLAPVVTCAVKSATLVDPHSSMYANDGPNKQIPYPLLSRHGFADWVIYAIHMQQDGNWGECPSDPELSEPIIPCVAYVNATNKDAWCHPKPSKLLQEWMEEWVAGNTSSANSKWWIWLVVAIAVVLLIYCCFYRRRAKSHSVSEVFSEYLIEMEEQGTYYETCPGQMNPRTTATSDSLQLSNQSTAGVSSGINSAQLNEGRNSSEPKIGTGIMDSECLDIIERIGTTEHYSSILIAQYADRQDQILLKRIFNWDKSTSHEILQEQTERLEALRHPNIATLTATTFFNYQHLHAVYSNAAKGTLRTVLMNPSIDLSWSIEKIQLAQDCASGLMYLHNFQPPLLHGNLNSYNVLVTPDLHALLAGFGFTTIAATRTLPLDLWTAPEVLKAEPFTDKADVYSMGMLLIEMDTRALPLPKNVDEFKLHGSMESRGINPDDHPAVTQQCPSFIEEIVDNCLQIDPTKRPTAFQLLLEISKITENMFEDAESNPSVDLDEREQLSSIRTLNSLESARV